MRAAPPLRAERNVITMTKKEFGQIRARAIINKMIDGVEVSVRYDEAAPEVTNEEARVYVMRGRRREPAKTLSYVKVEVRKEDIRLSYSYKEKPYECIPRIQPEVEQGSNRRFYATYCPYGITTISEEDVAYSFPSKAERDVWVNEDKDPFNPTRCGESLSEIKRRKLRIRPTEELYLQEANGIADWYEEHYPLLKGFGGKDSDSNEPWFDKPFEIVRRGTLADGWSLEQLPIWHVRITEPGFEETPGVFGVYAYEIFATPENLAAGRE